MAAAVAHFQQGVVEVGPDEYIYVEGNYSVTWPAERVKLERARQLGLMEATLDILEIFYAQWLWWERAAAASLHTQGPSAASPSSSREP